MIRQLAGALIGDLAKEQDHSAASGHEAPALERIKAETSPAGYFCLCRRPTPLEYRGLGRLRGVGAARWGVMR